ncbi:UPF0182 family protein [Coleofasciculus sp. FACHB-1120]|uniref:UPF0182 family protein n=1 Tax=Coleofasciculus sp. FACHB-1120 TaxID=2692783 RepID=UPI001686C2D8|nr:UPF0182 family protein [Coleofasciculus sp. FACHB-1120]MBD2740719.1 UPF0182 family protein [Coleofasciculus sp. FACHB-1120]
MNRIFPGIVLLLGMWLAFDLVAYLVADVFWFQEVGYLPAFFLRLSTQAALGTIAFIVTAGFLLGNLYLAHRLKYSQEIPPTGFKKGEVDSPFFLAKQHVSAGVRGEQVLSEEDRRESFSSIRPQSSALKLRSLLPLLGVLSLAIGLMLLHYGQIAASYWHSKAGLPSVSPLLPVWFQPELIWQMGRKMLSSIWQVVVVLVSAALVLIYPQFLLTAIALVLSLFFGLVLSSHWARILQYFHPTSFNSVDPLFGRDISSYVFQLPVWELLEFWFFGLFLYGFVAVTLIYVLSGDSFSEGRFLGFSKSQIRHLCGLGGFLCTALALGYWLLRYQLLYSTTGVTYGASYTDVSVRLPLYTGLSFFSLAMALFLFWQTIQLKIKAFKLKIVLLGFLIFNFSFLIVLPAAVQRLIVQPNELQRERPFIQRSIAFTRQAFDLEDIEVQTFNPTGQLTADDLQNNDLTIDNIRLWDTRPLLQTNRQLQQIRLYYQFPDADIDRYTLKTEEVAQKTPATSRQQVLIAARELDYSSVPQQAQTWVNEHLVYTHGYGFTLSPVNTVGQGGLPDYFVRDIGTEGGEAGTLKTSSEAIRASIPIETPRIYYGEISNTYVMTSTRARELDFPSGDENVYNTYDGRGGISIGAWWRRLLFSEYLKDWQMLLTRDFTPKTKLLFRRNINQRIRAIAPFLRYDSEPYLVAANAGDNETQSYLYWIVDAYTTSDRYPYSDPGKYDFNYMRNSVKVVIDAYNGSANFYIADPNDPIIHSWSDIFPGLFKPLNEMPATLRSHIRYPMDFFTTQSERLLTYHMTDQQVFYNREDQWRIPMEIYAAEQQAVEPYFLIMRLPTAQEEEFILLLPFTPIQRNNLIAWLAARSDGENYGKLLLYQFPKQQLIYGTEQIEALINQDPVISQQISLWNRQGSRAIQGNLLVIPIEQSLLYVEPLYLEAEQNSLPTLVRVIVAYENRIVMAETLEEALQAIFQPEESATPAIIRPVEPSVAP